MNYNAPHFLAGVFLGEGNIDASTYGLRLSVECTDPAIVYGFFKRYGGTCKIIVREGRRTCLRWRVSNAELTMKVLSELLPYMPPASTKTREMSVVIRMPRHRDDPAERARCLKQINDIRWADRGREMEALPGVTR